MRSVQRPCSSYVTATMQPVCAPCQLLQLHNSCTMTALTGLARKRSRAQAQLAGLNPRNPESWVPPRGFPRLTPSRSTPVTTCEQKELAPAQNSNSQLAGASTKHFSCLLADSSGFPPP